MRGKAEIIDIQKHSIPWLPAYRHTPTFSIPMIVLSLLSLFFFIIIIWK